VLINTHSKTINVHTLVLDDNEIERILDDGDAFRDTLNELLMKKKSATPKLQRKPKRRARAKKSKQTGGLGIAHRQPCEWCGRLIAQGFMEKHQRACPQRPALERDDRQS